MDRATADKLIDMVREYGVRCRRHALIADDRSNSHLVVTESQRAPDAMFEAIKYTLHAHSQPLPKADTHG